MSTDNRDALIRLALTPAVDAAAPADLARTIYDEILVTPQRRALIPGGRFSWVPATSRTLVAVGLLLLLAVALVIAALSRAPAAPVLAMYHGGPDRTGVMPGPGPVVAPVIAWAVPRPGALAFNTMPLPADGRLFVGDESGVLAAIDQVSGATLWEVPVGSAISGAPALIDSLVAVGTAAGEVVAVDTATGREAWRRDLASGGVTASLLVADRVVYAATDGGSLAALDPASGAIRWSISVGGAVTRGAVFGDGVVYVGATGGSLSAVDVATQSRRWSVQLGTGNVGTPTVGDGLVYVGRGLLAADPPHDLVALRIADGSTAWAFSAPTGEQVHMGGLAHGRVYAPSEDGRLYALDAATGQGVWTAQVGDRLTTVVAIVDDVVYLSAEPRSVHAIDARTGRELWAISIVGDGSAPAVLGGRMFVGTDLGQVIAIAGGSGSSVAP